MSLVIREWVLSVGGDCGEFSERVIPHLQSVHKTPDSLLALQGNTISKVIHPDHQKGSTLTDLLTYLTHRRSTPFPLMGDEGPDDKTLAAILQLAARVPDHGKLAPWRFIIIPRSAGEILGTFLEGLLKADKPDATEPALAVERGRFLRAPLCVAVVSSAAPHDKIPVWEQELSAGALCLNLLNAAAAHGFGGTWITEWLTFDRRVAEHFRLAAHERFAGFIHLSKPRGRADDRVRPDMASITSIYGA